MQVLAKEVHDKSLSDTARQAVYISNFQDWLRENYFLDGRSRKYRFLGMWNPEVLTWQNKLIKNFHTFKRYFSFLSFESCVTNA